MAPPGSPVRLLDQVLGPLGRAQHPVAVSQRLTPEPAGDIGEILADRHRYPDYRRPASTIKVYGPVLMPHSVMANVRPPVLVSYAAFVLIGITAGVSGVLLPAQMGDYGVDRATIGITFFTTSAGFVLAGL